MKLCNLFNEWLFNYNKRRIRMSTFARYKQIINGRFANSTLISMEISEITKKDIQSYIYQLLDEKSFRGTPLMPRTINGEIKVLHAALNYAVNCSYIDKNPCTKVKMVKVPKTNILFRCFLIEEQRLIEQYCYDHIAGITSAILFAVYTGMRLGEVAGLKWENVDLDNDIIYVKQTLIYGPNYDGKYLLYTSIPKTKSSIREIPLPYIARNLLLSIKTRTTEYIFTNKYGKEIIPQYISFTFKCITEDLNVNNLSFHSLRHTFATRALEAGADPKTISEILGHASVSITLKTYGHSTSFHKHESINKIPREVSRKWM